MATTSTTWHNCVPVFPVDFASARSRDRGSRPEQISFRSQLPRAPLAFKYQDESGVVAELQQHQLLFYIIVYIYVYVYIYIYEYMMKGPPTPWYPPLPVQWVVVLFGLVAFPVWSCLASSPPPLWSGACGLFGCPAPPVGGQCVLQRCGMGAAAC